MLVSLLMAIGLQGEPARSNYQQNLGSGTVYRLGVVRLVSVTSAKAPGNSRIYFQSRFGQSSVNNFGSVLMYTRIKRGHLARSLKAW